MKPKSERNIKFINFSACVPLTLFPWNFFATLGKFETGKNYAIYEKHFNLIRSFFQLLKVTRTDFD